MNMWTLRRSYGQRATTSGRFLQQTEVPIDSFSCVHSDVTSPGNGEAAPGGGHGFERTAQSQPEPFLDHNSTEKRYFPPASHDSTTNNAAAKQITRWVLYSGAQIRAPTPRSGATALQSRPAFFRVAGVLFLPWRELTTSS